MKLRSIFLCQNPKSIDYVYSPEQQEEVAALTDLRRRECFNKDELAGMGGCDAEVIFSTWGMPAFTEEEIARLLPDLKLVFYGAGATDAFVRPFLKRGVKVVSAWQMNAIPVAEFCLGQIILALKGFFRNTRELTGPEMWRRDGAFTGPGAYGETVALIGAGAISAHLQELLKPFHVNVLVIPSRPERRTVSLEEAFRKAFIISNHLPNREDNIGVLNRKLFQSMRPGAVFINTGRGAQVDEAGLIEVMEARPDLTALLDVTHPEPPAAGSKLYTTPNIQLTSHIAGSLNDEVHRMAACVIGEFRRFQAGEPLQYEVDESMLLTSC